MFFSLLSFSRAKSPAVAAGILLPGKWPYPLSPQSRSKSSNNIACASTPAPDFLLSLLRDSSKRGLDCSPTRVG